MSTLVTELVEAGVHYGHRASRWNPKMRPYIYARKNLIHIIDVRETIRGLLRAKKYLSQVASRNGQILFVGTKRQAAETIEREAARCGSPYVNLRWLGGTLTNFRTIRNRLSRLEELEVLRASDAENADLFWAIRGGGGNFGVATEFVYRLHAFNPSVYGGNLFYSFDQARDFLHFYAKFNETLPDEASVEPQFIFNENGEPVLMVEVCYAGDHAAGEKVMAPLVAFGKRLSGELGAVSYQQMQTSVDAMLAHGGLYYLKSGFLIELTEASIDAMVGNFKGDHLPFTWFQHLGGASARVAPDATAYPHRNVQFNYGIMDAWSDPAESDMRIAAVRRYYKALEPHMKGFYTNLNDDTEKKTWGNFGENYPRLVEVKNRYDPANLFRLNANIQPTV